MAMPSSAHKEIVEEIAAPSNGSCVQQGTAEAEAISLEVLECAAKSDSVIVICGLKKLLSQGDVGTTPGRDIPQRQG